MKVTVAETAGFCMGVRRAVEMALEASIAHPGPIYTYGSLIHNPQVLALLREKDIHILGEIPERGSGTVLIRAHGVPPDVRERLETAGFSVIDATCPRVIKVQTVIARHAPKGGASIIIGDKDHPEVVGLLGYAGNAGYVVDNLQDLDALPLFDDAIIVVQTTQNTWLLQEVKAWAEKKAPHYKIFDTICGSTERRQEEVIRLSEAVDALVVVGGKNSGNTQRLAEIGRQSGKPTFHIETENEIDFEKLGSADTVGVTAGASTPNWIINRVCRTLETIPYRKARGALSIFFRVQRVLLPTNIYVSLGAGCLCYACSLLQEITESAPYVLITMLYIQSMHILNNLTGIREDKYNDPERASFYNNHKGLLSFFSVMAGGMGLLTALAMGVFPFLVLLAMSIMGLSYNRRWIPRGTGHRYRSLRDIPGSKTILIALAWGIVTSIFPPLSETGAITATNILVFFMAALLVLVRTAFLDILDIQGDRVIGKGTIPVLLGAKESMRLLKMLLGVVILFMVIPPAFGLTSTLGYLLAICPLCMLALFSAYDRGALVSWMLPQFLVDTCFVLAGGIGFVWSVLQ